MKYSLMSNRSLNIAKPSWGVVLLYFFIRLPISPQASSGCSLKAIGFIKSSKLISWLSTVIDLVHKPSVPLYCSSPESTPIPAPTKMATASACLIKCAACFNMCSMQISVGPYLIVGKNKCRDSQADLQALWAFLFPIAMWSVDQLIH